MTKPIDYNINVGHYNSPFNPKKPTHAANMAVMSLKILAETVKVSTGARKWIFVLERDVK